MRYFGRGLWTVDRDSACTITLVKWLFRCAAPGTPMEKRVHALGRAACATGRDGDMDAASRENSGRLRLGKGMRGFSMEDQKTKWEELRMEW